MSDFDNAIDDIVDTNASVIRNTREREEERKEDDNKNKNIKKGLDLENTTKQRKDANVQISKAKREEVRRKRREKIENETENKKLSEEELKRELERLQQEAVVRDKRIREVFRLININIPQGDLNAIPATYEQLSDLGKDAAQLLDENISLLNAIGAMRNKYFEYQRNTNAYIEYLKKDIENLTNTDENYRLFVQKILTDILDENDMELDETNGQAIFDKLKEKIIENRENMNKLGISNKEIEQLTSRIDSLNRQLQEKQNTIENMTVEIQNDKKENTILQRQNQELDRKLQLESDEIENYKKEIIQLREVINQKNMPPNTSNKTIKDAYGKLQQLQQQLMDLTTSDFLKEDYFLSKKRRERYENYLNSKR